MRGQKPNVLMTSIDGMKPEYMTEVREHRLKLQVLLGISLPAAKLQPEAHAP